MEAGPLGRELDEHGDGAVRLGRRRREEAVGDLALHHHAPELELLDARGSRRRSASRCCTEGSRRACAAADRGRGRRGRARRPSARSCASIAARCSSRRRSTSAAWTCATRSARKRVSTPSPGPISSTTSAGSSSASRSITRRMFSSTRKCWPRALARDEPHAARRRASRSRRASVRTSSPRSSERKS